jgi:hypothetical protein
MNVSENPKKLYCSKCKREVYQTLHTATTYYADWFRSKETNNKVICKDCYKKN